MEITVHTEQIKALEDFFDGLSTADQRKIFMQAFRRGTKPMVAEARMMVPVLKRATKRRPNPGDLLRSIGTIELKDEVAILMGARRGGGYKGNIGHIIERGTQERSYITRKGKTKNVGRVKPTPFIEPAYTRNEDYMVDTVQEEWMNVVDRMIQRLNKQKR